MRDSTLIQPIVENLPKDISALQTDAANEGYNFVDRLLDEWATNLIRFDGPGEALLVARQGQMIAGVGGMTIEPSDKTALRMRRFYVRPIYRRTGIARELAATLLANTANNNRRIFVNAGNEIARPFWESLGFKPIPSQDYTHALSK